MNAIGKSSVVFVTLSGLFWGGWVLGSQTPEGQQALARAYQAYADQQATANEDLFNTTALRAVVCGSGGAEHTAQKPCIAVVAAGKLFIVDAGSGATDALVSRNFPMDRLQAVLLTSAGVPQTGDLDELYAASARGRVDALLPVYGPASTQRLVEGLNQAAGFDGAQRGLQAWGPSPEPGRQVIVYQNEGLTVSAFTTSDDGFANTRVAYRFDYRGRSIVVGADGATADSPAANNANVVLQSDGENPAQAAAEGHAANAGLVVLTGASNQMAAQVQVAEARAAGYNDVISARVGMVLELPLANNEVNVRAL